MRKKLILKRLGFTLLELMIVVMIIGVLALIGVPTYKRMKQKAHKAEAKLFLGAVYTAETMFNSEYGVYGTNLGKMGYDVSSLTATGTPGLYEGALKFYTVGFPNSSSTCTPQAPNTGSTADPKVADYINGYYNLASSIQIFARPGVGIGSFCLPATLSANGDSFLATASGVIQPGVSPSTSDGTKVDQWSINENRILTNQVDGLGY